MDESALQMTCISYSQEREALKRRKELEEAKKQGYQMYLSTQTCTRSSLGLSAIWTNARHKLHLRTDSAVIRGNSCFFGGIFFFRTRRRLLCSPYPVIFSQRFSIMLFIPVISWISDKFGTKPRWPHVLHWNSMECGQIGWNRWKPSFIHSIRKPWHRTCTKFVHLALLSVWKTSESKKAIALQTIDQRMQGLWGASYLGSLGYFTLDLTYRTAVCARGNVSHNSICPLCATIFTLKNFNQAIIHLSSIRFCILKDCPIHDSWQSVMCFHQENLSLFPNRAHSILLTAGKRNQEPPLST